MGKKKAKMNGKYWPIRKGYWLSTVYNSSSSTDLHAMSGAKAILLARTE